MFMNVVSEAIRNIRNVRCEMNRIAIVPSVVSPLEQVEGGSYPSCWPGDHIRSPELNLLAWDE
jgi:hypothetical protein